MHALRQDVRYALRWLAKNPGFTAVTARRATRIDPTLALRHE